MKLDRRDCPDDMHIRQFIYLERTSPRVLSAHLYPHHRERTRAETGGRGPRPVNPAGMIRQRFAQQFPTGNRCELCGVHTERGEAVAYWGHEPHYGHALCRIAQWTARHDHAEARRAANAMHARRRRQNRTAA